MHLRFWLERAFTFKLKWPVLAGTNLALGVHLRGKTLPYVHVFYQDRSKTKDKKSKKCDLEGWKLISLWCFFAHALTSGKSSTVSTKKSLGLATATKLVSCSFRKPCIRCSMERAFLRYLTNVEVWLDEVVAFCVLREVSSCKLWLLSTGGHEKLWTGWKDETAFMGWNGDGNVRPSVAFTLCLSN